MTKLTSKTESAHQTVRASHFLDGLGHAALQKCRPRPLPSTFSENQGSFSLRLFWDVHSSQGGLYDAHFHRERPAVRLSTSSVQTNTITEASPPEKRHFRYVLSFQSSGKLGRSFHLLAIEVRGCYTEVTPRKRERQIWFSKVMSLPSLSKIITM